MEQQLQSLIEKSESFHNMAIDMNRIFTIIGDDVPREIVDENIKQLANGVEQLTHIIKSIEKKYKLDRQRRERSTRAAARLSVVNPPVVSDLPTILPEVVSLENVDLPVEHSDSYDMELRAHEDWVRSHCEHVFRDGPITIDFDYSRIRPSSHIENALYVAHQRRIDRIRSEYLPTILPVNVEQQNDLEIQEAFRGRAEVYLNPVIRTRKPKSKKTKAVNQRMLDSVMPDACGICLNTNTRGETVSTSCGHHFCGDCFDHWAEFKLQHPNASNRVITCPICRQAKPTVTQFRLRKQRVSKAVNSVVDTNLVIEEEEEEEE